MSKVLIECAELLIDARLLFVLRQSTPPRASTKAGADLINDEQAVATEELARSRSFESNTKYFRPHPKSWDWPVADTVTSPFILFLEPQMKQLPVAYALVVSGLCGCSMYASVLQIERIADQPFEVKIERYAHPEINEAASSYVSLYMRTVRATLSERKYQPKLAWLHLNAESCLDSRNYRLTKRHLQAKEKLELLQDYMPETDLQTYHEFAKGYFTRVNALETFSCEIAGLKVDRTNVRF